MASKKIEVIIAGDTSKLTSALREAGTEVKGFDETTAKSSGGLSKMKGAVGALAGAGGLLALGSTLKSSVTASEDEQAAIARMTTAFKNAGQPMGEYRDGIEQAESKGRQLGFTNEQVESTLTSLVTATHSGKKAIADLSVTEDLARARHVSLDVASKTLTKAMSGSTGAARQLGITIIPVTKNMDALRGMHLKTTSAEYLHLKAIDMLKDKQLTAAQVIGTVSKAVHGQADAFSKTGAGALQSYKAQIDNVEAQIGGALIPVLTTLAGVLSTVLNWVQQHKTETEILGGTIAAVVIATKAWTVATSVAGAATEAWTAIQGAFNVVMDADPIVLVGVALVALGAALVVAYNKVGWFKDGVQAAFGVVKDAVNVGVGAFDAAKTAISGAIGAVRGAVDTVINFIKDNWRTIAPILLGPLAPLGELVTHFGDVKSAAGDVWNAIKTGVGDAISFIGKLGDSIGGIPGKIGSIIGGIASDAEGIGKSIITGIANGLKGAVSIAGDIGTAVGRAVQDAINSVIDFVNGAIDKVHVHVPLLGDIGFPKDPIPHVSLFAKGTYNAPAGWAIVGEQGPELMHVPGGSRIVPAGQTQRMLADGQPQQARAPYIDMRGARLNSPHSARALADRLAFRLQHG